MPGSHKAAFNGHLQPLSEEHGGTETMPFSVPQDQLPCVVFESQPGDVGIFSECTWHAAFGGAPGRSQHAISYQANPQNDAQLAYLKELCAKYKYSLHPPEEMVKSDNPRIQNMISRLLELGVGPPEPMPIFEG